MRYLQIFPIVILCSNLINAQDPLEYHYLIPSFPSRDTRPIDKKPPIEGWAKERITEHLDRGAVAVQQEKGTYLSWRLLNNDPPDVAFDVYRSENGGEYRKINGQPIDRTCDFLDRGMKLHENINYQVKAVTGGKETKPSSVENLPEGYLSIPLQGEYSPEKIAIADLNGDGKFDFVIKQSDGSLGGGIRGNVNPGLDKGTTYKLEAYLHDGTFLWRKDMGLGIEPGTWYSPYVVYDFDGDGKAELAAKTAGTDFKRDESGRVLSGSEYLTIYDGMSGNEIVSTDWIPRSPRLGNYGRLNRNQMGVAYLDGKTPFLLIERGTYKAMFLEAYTYRDKKLKKYWRWDGDEENPVVRHQGAHSMQSADVDNDGREEVVLGSVIIDDTGDALWSTGYGHPDKCYVTDILPERPGMEIFYSIEDTHEDGKGVCLVDAASGETIWTIGHKTIHVGSGMVADIMPEHAGLECFAGEAAKAGSTDRYMLSAEGKYLARNHGVPQFGGWVFWDADLLRETLISNGGTDRNTGGSSVGKYGGKTYPRQIEGRLNTVADLFGDWREELVMVLPGEMRIYTTSIHAADRRVTLIQDPVYRATVAHFSMGYHQTPMTGYYLGTNDSKNEN